MNVLELIQTGGVHYSGAEVSNRRSMFRERIYRTMQNRDFEIIWRQELPQECCSPRGRRSKYEKRRTLQNKTRTHMQHVAGRYREDN